MAQTATSFRAYGSNFPRIWIGDVVEAIAHDFAIDRKAMASANRARVLAWPRQAAMLLIRRLTRNSLPAIGMRFGGRDHTTVLHGCRVATARAEADAAMDIRLARIERALLDRAALREAAELLAKGLPTIGIGKTRSAA